MLERCVQLQQETIFGNSKGQQHVQKSQAGIHKMEKANSFAQLYERRGLAYKVKEKINPRRYLEHTLKPWV